MNLSLCLSDVHTEAVQAVLARHVERKVAVPMPSKRRSLVVQTSMDAYTPPGDETHTTHTQTHTHTPFPHTRHISFFILGGWCLEEMILRQCPMVWPTWSQQQFHLNSQISIITCKHEFDHFPEMRCERERGSHTHKQTHTMVISSELDCRKPEIWLQRCCPVSRQD